MCSTSLFTLSSCTPVLPSTRRLYLRRLIECVFRSCAGIDIANSCGMEYGGEHRWTARDRVVMVRLVRYQDRSESLEVDIEELEDCLLRPLNARGEKHRRLFHTLSSQELSEFLVASVERWDEYSRMLSIHEQKCPNHQRHERKERKALGYDG